MRRSLQQCPVCDSPLAITELQCRGCGTALRGEFQLAACPFCALPPEQFRFLELFLRCRGNMRDVERTLGLSYPTIRARLDTLLNALGYTAAAAQDTTEQRREILEALNTGGLTADEAIAMLEELR
jgi:hypothetical protein